MCVFKAHSAKVAEWQPQQQQHQQQQYEIVPSYVHTAAAVTTTAKKVFDGNEWVSAEIECERERKPKLQPSNLRLLSIFQGMDKFTVHCALSTQKLHCYFVLLELWTILSNGNVQPFDQELFCSFETVFIYWVVDITKLLHIYFYACTPQMSLTWIPWIYQKKIDTKYTLMCDTDTTTPN